MTDLIEVKTADLVGEALGWAIEQIEGPLPKPAGQLQLAFCADSFATDVVERLIEKYCVWIDRGAHVPWVASIKLDPFEREGGDTREHAACRAIVANRIGRTVQVPKELMR
ncbi:hypothetical protein [Pseudomonas qingdaonensis]|uniref:hypothetical protein n=1 Tax=Pseudomonas qingdaonensis TaxID=2056231 RepID=UPI0028A7295A|nr:hypothetical protein [Pseudomonas qingdaonensis]